MTLYSPVTSVLTVGVAPNVGKLVLCGSTVTRGTIAASGMGLGRDTGDSVGARVVASSVGRGLGASVPTSKVDTGGTTETVGLYVDTVTVGL